MQLCTKFKHTFFRVIVIPNFTSKKKMKNEHIYKIVLLQNCLKQLILKHIIVKWHTSSTVSKSITIPSPAKHNNSSNSELFRNLRVKGLKCYHPHFCTCVYTNDGWLKGDDGLCMYIWCGGWWRGRGGGAHKWHIDLVKRVETICALRWIWMWYVRGILRFAGPNMTRNDCRIYICIYACVCVGMFSVGVIEMLLQHSGRALVRICL